MLFPILIANILGSKYMPSLKDENVEQRIALMFFINIPTLYNFFTEKVEDSKEFRNLLSLSDESKILKKSQKKKKEQDWNFMDEIIKIGKRVDIETSEDFYSRSFRVGRFLSSTEHLKYPTIKSFEYQKTCCRIEKKDLKNQDPCRIDPTFLQNHIDKWYESEKLNFLKNNREKQNLKYKEQQPDYFLLHIDHECKILLNFPDILVEGKNYKIAAVVGIDSSAENEICVGFEYENKWRFIKKDKDIEVEKLPENFFCVGAIFIKKDWKYTTQHYYK